MTRTPSPPITVEQLPQQRVVEVVDLPSVPDHFEPVACLYWMPEDILPKQRPRRMTFLGTVEWAWSPMSGRVESYYLHRGRRHWIVWIRDRDCNDLDYEWTVAGYVDRTDVSADAAAVHLIVARWLTEVAESELDHFHWLLNDGALSVAQWVAIGRHVWKPVRR